MAAAIGFAAGNASTSGRSRSRPNGLAKTGGPDPAAALGGSDRDLDAAFDRLDADHRIVVLLRFWQDLSLEEIADRLDLPLGTVKSRLHYALRTLRTDLEATDGRV
jgi:RNA polymerase sigma-70 factor (ECF subfamily)